MIWKYLLTLLQALRWRHYGGWFAVFLSANVIPPIYYGTNPESRFAVLAALVEDRSFSIDSYQQLTIDWARTPDGKYFSNKAPGPIFVALPLYWILDRALTAGVPERADRDIIRLSNRRTMLTLLSFALQAIPYSVLVLMSLQWLELHGATAPSLHLACVAMLFGNTSSLFMSSYFGHGMVAAFVLGLCLSLLTDQYVLSGICFGFALLSDYAVTMLLPGYLFLLAIGRSDGPRWTKFASVLAGGLVPGLLWMCYHYLCFGGIFTLPTEFQNPEFVDFDNMAVFGVFRWLPDWEVLGELMFGTRRGLLWTQPWLLMVFGGWIVNRAGTRTVGAALPALVRLEKVLLPGLALLLCMNAAFGEWHAGGTPGPRYISSILPAFALLLPSVHQAAATAFRNALLVGVAVSALLWAGVYSTTVVVPMQSAWTFVAGQLFRGDSFGSVWRLIVLVVALDLQAMLVIARISSQGR